MNKSRVTVTDYVEDETLSLSIDANQHILGRKNIAGKGAPQTFLRLSIGLPELHSELWGDEIEQERERNLSYIHKVTNSHADHLKIKRDIHR